jgi:hypothetical protein
MFKRIVCSAVLLVAAVSGPAEAGSLDRVSIRLDSGTCFSLHGNYNESYKLKEMVLPGAGLGMTVRFRVYSSFFLEAGYAYNWMFLKKDMRPSAYTADKPALILPMYTLNGTVFMSSSESVRPYFTLGCGICPWRFSSEAIRGEIWEAPLDSNAQFSKNSLILNTGLGIEIILWSHVSFVADVKYQYLFAKNDELFGTEGFNNQGFLGIRLGIVFSFGRQKSPAQEEDIN